MTPSESHPVLGIVVGHGDVPRALLAAATEIVGDAGDTEAISNKGSSLESLGARVEAVVAGHPDRDVLLLVDMFGSSCYNVSNACLRSHPNVAVVCGLNLPMLVRFLYHRRKKGLKELVELMHQTARDEVHPASSDQGFLED